MKTHMFFDTVLLFAVLAFIIKFFVVMAGYGSAMLSMTALPGEFQYLMTLLF